MPTLVQVSYFVGPDHVGGFFNSVVQPESRFQNYFLKKKKKIQRPINVASGRMLIGLPLIGLLDS